MTFFFRTTAREFLNYRRKPGLFLNPLIFFGLVVFLFVVGLGPDEAKLNQAASIFILVASLLSVLMSAESAYDQDYEEGSLELVVVSSNSLFLYSLAKSLAHWVVTFLPLILLVPFIGIGLFLDVEQIWVLCLGILLVSPTIILLASVGAAMTISLPRNGVLIGVLVLPFYVPPLIFVTGLFEAALLKQNVFPYVYWLTGLFFLALGLAPSATSACLRIAVED
jgi:heme exporter protein B